MSSEIINLNNSTPAAPSAAVNVAWQKGASSGTDPASGLPIYPTSANLPAATMSELGVVKPDGTSITIDATGKISAPGGGGGGGGSLTAPVVLPTGAPTNVGLSIEATSGTNPTPAFVQGAVSNNTSAASYTLAFASNNTAGNAIIVVVYEISYGSEQPTVTDNNGNSYSFVVSSGVQGLYAFVAFNIAAGPNTVTVTFPFSVTGEIAIHEYSGIGDAVDGSSGGGGAWGAATTTPTGSITTTNADDLLFSALGAAGTPTSTPSGFNVRENLWAGGNQIATADMVVNATGSYSPLWIVNPCQDSQAICLALKAGGAPTQSANLLQFEDATGAVLSAVNNKGQIVLPASGGYPSNQPSAGALAYDSSSQEPVFFNGTLWAPMSGGGGSGGAAPWLSIVNPVTVGFSWLNQGGATENVGGASRFLLAPTSSGDQVRGRQIAASAPPFSVTAGLIPQCHNQNYNQFGLYASDGTKIVSHTCSNTEPLSINQWNNASSWSSTPLDPNIPMFPGLIFLKIYDDGTNLNFMWSVDGLNFITYYSQARLSWLASVSYFGYYANASNPTWPCAVLCVSWTTGTS